MSLLICCKYVTSFCQRCEESLVRLALCYIAVSRGESWYHLMRALMTGRYSVHGDSIAMQYCAVLSPRRGTATSQHMYDRHPITCRHITSPHPSPAAQWLLEEWWSWRRTKECRPLLPDSTINRAMQWKERRENEMKLVVLVNWIAHLYHLLSYHDYWFSNVSPSSLHLCRMRV